MGAIMDQLTVGSPGDTVFLPLIDAFRTHKKIHGLKEDTTYVVYIWAHTSKGPGVVMKDEGRTLVAASMLIQQLYITISTYITNCWVM